MELQRRERAGRLAPFGQYSAPVSGILIDMQAVPTHAKTTKNSTKKPATDFLLVRQRPTLGLESDSSYTLMRAGRSTRITGFGWHRVPHDVGVALRGVPLHDLSSSSPRRFDVLTPREFDEFVRRERARLGADQERRAREAAESAARAALDEQSIAFGSIEVIDAPVTEIKPEKRARKPR